MGSDVQVQEGTPGTLIIGDDLEGQAPEHMPKHAQSITERHCLPEVDWAPSAGDPPARGLLVQAHPMGLTSLINKSLCGD